MWFDDQDDILFHMQDYMLSKDSFLVWCEFILISLDHNEMKVRPLDFVHGQVIEPRPGTKLLHHKQILFVNNLFKYDGICSQWFS